MTRSAPLTKVAPLEGVAKTVAEAFVLPLATLALEETACLLTQFVVDPCETVKFPEYINDGKSAALPCR
jgi:hypothetical protein